MDESNTPLLVSAADAPAQDAATILQRLGPAGLLGIAWMLMPALCGFFLLAKLEPISNWLAAQGSMGVLIYIAVFIVSSGFGLLPTYAQAILGGWVFGVTVGLPAALLGFAGGSMIGYEIARFASRHRVEKLIDENIRARAVRDALIGGSFWKTFGIVSLVRVPPNSPFALTNLLLSSTGVRRRVYLPATVIGMAPRTAVTVAFAAAASSTGAKSIVEFAKDKWLMLVIGLPVMVVVLAIIGYIANKAIERVTRTQSPAEVPAT